MIWLGLFLSIFSVPGFTSATVPAGWAALSLASPWVLRRDSIPSPLLWLTVAFLAYACVSSLWAPDWHNSIWRLWEFSCIALAIYLGASLRSLKGLAVGIAIGCTVSSLLSVGQAFGWQPVLWYTINGQAGLFYNPVFQGMTLALVILLLVQERLYLLIPLLLPGLYLSHSRGAWVALIVGLAVWRTRWAWITVLAYLAVLLYTTYALSDAEHERLQIIVASIPHLSFCGNGAGAFADFYIGPRPLRPEYAHNDFLQLAFEFGLGAIPIYAIFAYGIATGNGVLAAFTVLGAFTFPLFTPIPAILFGVIAGYHSVCANQYGIGIDDGRYDFLSRFPGWHSNKRAGNIPLQPQT